MLFTLIKNELIKLMKKGKTWIVFGLFMTVIGITIFTQYKQDKDIIAWNTPEVKLQNANDELEYVNEELESNKESNSPDYNSSLEQRKIQLADEIKAYKDIIENGEDENAWKVELDLRISECKEIIENSKEYDDEWSKNARLVAEENLEIYTYLKENNMEPINGWEYEANNYMQTIMDFLSLAILVCGIAVFMSDIVSGECTPATLKFLLIQPVSRGKVLLSKFIAVTLTVITMIVGGELLGCGFVKLTRTIDGGNYPVSIGTLYKKVINADGVTDLVKIAGSSHTGTNTELFVKSILLQVLFIITACAFVFMVSTLIKSSMVTMAVSVVVTVFLTIASTILSPLMKVAHLIFVNYGNTSNLVMGNSAIMYSNPAVNIKTGIIVMLVTILVSYIIAHFNFKNKDILI